MNWEDAQLAIANHDHFLPGSDFSLGPLSGQNGCQRTTNPYYSLNMSRRHPELFILMI